MICHMKRPDPAVADRVPPGQVLTEKWPVLTYGRTPRFDPKRWAFRCFVLVDRPTPWTWEEFLRLPRITVRSDVHYVTRWSKLDNERHGAPWREERYSGQETRAMQQMRAEAARTLRERS